MPEPVRAEIVALEKFLELAERSALPQRSTHARAGNSSEPEAALRVRH